MENSPVPWTGPFLTRDAIELGVDRRELDGPEYHRSHRSVRSREACVSPLDWARAYLPLMHEKLAFSSLTAARFWGLPAPARLRHDRTVHLVVPTGTTRPRRARVETRSLPVGEWATRTLGGVTVTDPALTWLTLARMYSVDELVMVADALITEAENYRGLVRTGGLTSLDELRERASLRINAAGAGRARRALPLVRAGVESPMESVTRLLMLRAGLPEPVTAFRVDLEHGRHLRIDLAYPDLKVAVEYDGREAHETPAQQIRDAWRINKLQELGWIVIRVTAEQLFPRADEVLAAIFAALRARGARV